MRNRLGVVLTALSFALMCVCALCAAIAFVGTDDDLYFRLQMRAGILDEAGVSEADLQKLDHALSRCLSGRADWNEEPDADGGEKPLHVVVFGEERPAFNEREIRHMQDCQALFRRIGSGWDSVVKALLFALVLANVIYLTKNRKQAMGAICVGAALVVAPLAALGLWAALDFGSAFTFFHEMLFTNDLWLLDPATDLLIRICPSSMFATMGLRIALYCLAGMAVLSFLAWGIVRFGAKTCGIKRKFYNEFGL